MNFQQREKERQKLASKFASELVGCTSAIYFVQKNERTEYMAIEHGSTVGEIFVNLATNPLFYASMKFAVTVINNKKGNGLFNSTLKKFNLNEDGTTNQKLLDQTGTDSTDEVQPVREDNDNKEEQQTIS